MNAIDRQIESDVHERKSGDDDDDFFKGLLVSVPLALVGWVLIAFVAVAAYWLFFA